ncbi:MAG: threonine synthase, partial [Pseudomonadota bacterium]
AFRDEVGLGAVNSINWARIAAQVVYYFHAASRLGAPHRPLRFAVPTGNFGDVFAGYVAAQMGLPVEQLIVATNENDILRRALSAGDYSRAAVKTTSSPSMDIQVSSNFERLLFDLVGRDGAILSAMMQSFQTTGRLDLPEHVVSAAASHFAAEAVNEEDTATTIREVFQTTGELLDPHTAIGVAAARRHNDSQTSPIVVLGTAHPGKFRTAVERACGTRPSLPAHVGNLFDREERFSTLPNDLDALIAHIRERHAP